MKQKMLAVGTVVKLNAEPFTLSAPKISGDSLAADYGLKIGKSYTIKEVESCAGKCTSRPWCPGLLRVNGMEHAECWGYSSGRGHWFGLTCESILLREYAFGSTLDEILGIL